MSDQKGKADPEAVDRQVRQMNQDVLGKQCLSADLTENINTINGLFQHVDTMLSRRFQNNADARLDFCIYYSDGVVNSMMIGEQIIKPLLHAEGLHAGEGLFEAVRDRFVLINDVREVTRLTDIVQAITYGDTLLLIEGSDRALILSSKSFALRSISEPDEKVLMGPREGFTEGIMLNLSMLRRRLRTHQFKMRFLSMGRQTATGVCVCYLEGVVNKNLLKELYRRLDTIDIDGVLDSHYITEHIAESSILGFPTSSYTERPDIVTAKLLEGRIAVIVDGTPEVLTLPCLLIENFQSNEDYYANAIYGSFSRMLRILGFWLTIIIPALFVAVVAYHHEILPQALMINIAKERQSVPLTAAAECFVMLLVFDILREAGVRMPSNVGQAMSIVGALVIGQAAVAANLVASPMIIVVAFTGITSLLVHRMTMPALIGRYGCLILVSILGLTGLAIGLSILVIHMLNLQSLGVPSFLPNRQLHLQDVKDTFVRVPWPHMRVRSASFSNNRTRSRPGSPGGRTGGPQ